MCGITGKFNFDGSAVPEQLIKAMNNEITYRGPDDEGVFVSQNIGLGQRRLAINDLRPEATAPICNEDRTVWVVFNGEIYNFQELRTNLQAKGHRFSTATDTEVIVHAYEEYGHECLAHFNGMFAFALWDSKTEELFCARDRLGKKPFCYLADNLAFRFASEIKSLMADPAVTVRANYSSIESYIAFGYIAAPQSAFAGVEKLQAGHYLLCDKKGNVTVQRYWEPPRQLASHFASVEEAKSLLREHLREAVRLRMIADVPIGALLSGGIDSTSVVALMAQNTDAPIKTFSLGFKDEAQSELPYARMLAEMYGTEHHEFIVEPNAAEILPSLVRNYNEPFADSSAIATYYVSKFAREHVAVAMTGDGGDESFAGYTRYLDLQRWNERAKHFKSVSSLFDLSRWMLELSPHSNFLAKLNRGFLMMTGRLPDMYRLQMTSGLKPEEKKDLYTSDFKTSLVRSGEEDLVAFLENDYDLNAIEYAMRHDQTFYLPDCLMVKSDIASMANSLELRSPILDVNVVEFAATLPLAYRCNGSVGKWIMREAFKDDLPREILQKPKTGFSLPLDKWLRDDLNSMLRDHLLDSVARSRGIFQISKVEKMIQEHERGIRSWQNRLWNMLVLEIWFREFID